MEIDFSGTADILCVCTAEQMHASIAEALRYAAGKKMPVFYMTFTRPAGHILETLAKEKLPADRILIVDCSGNKEQKPYPQVIAVKGVEDLTGMSIAAFEFVSASHAEKLFIIDAINVLAQYSPVPHVSKMLRNIIHKDDEKQTKMLVFCTDARNEKLLSHIEHFFDQVVR